MRIAVNTVFLQKNKEYSSFLREIFSRLAKQHPEHEFFFLLSGRDDQQFINQPNMRPVIIIAAVQQVSLLKWALNIKVARLLRTIKADVLIQPYGFCNLVTRIPQLLIENELLFKNHSPLVAGWHKLLVPAFLRKAKYVITPSAFSKEAILRVYKIVPEKISVLYGTAATRFHPVNEEMRQLFRDKYSGGKEYFLFTGDILPGQELLDLLKAFSQFKKWQLSNMKLLINGNFPEVQLKAAKEKIKSYKYRDDIVLMDGRLTDDELTGLTASAYVVIFPSFFEGFGMPVMEVMQCGVPVIINNTGSLSEIAGVAGLYAGDPGTIAQRMIQLYKDEALRNRLALEGKNRALSFSWDKTTGIMWQNIKKTASA